MLQSVSPSTGPIAGDTAVALTGYGFTGATASSLLQPGFTVVNDTTITGVTVPGAVGVVSATVSNAIATSAPLANAFTYRAAPVVLAISPSTGPTTGSTAVSITVNDSSLCTAAHIGGVAVTGFAIVDATHVSGTTGGGMPIGADDVTVTNDIGTGTLVGAFNATGSALPAAPTAINKSLGDASGGTVVIITHPNTAGLTGAKVCGVALTSFSIVDSTHVQGTTAAMAASATPGDVVVTNASGDSPALAGVFEAFWPTNISSCIQWLRADKGVTVVGGKITKWADQSGVGVDMTDARSLGFLPAAPTTGLNGKLVVPFAAGDYGSNGDRLDNTTLPAGFTGVTAAECFLILGGNVSDPNGVWSYGPTGIGPWMPFSGNIYESFFLNGRPGGTATVSLASPCEYNVQSPGTNLFASINKVSVGLNVGGVFTAPSDITIGNNHAGGGGSQTIPELFLYGKILSTAERARVRLYENDRYGFSL